MKYYDKENNPITLEGYCELLADRNYKHVSRSKINHWVVSTVWLGLDHGHTFIEGAKPIIFETMIYKTGRTSISIKFKNFQVRYSTIKEANRGHADVLHELRRGLIR